MIIHTYARPVSTMIKIGMSYRVMGVAGIGVTSQRKKVRRMKLIVTMTDEEYNKLRYRRLPVSKMREVLLDGTPLPKGHGRLIDADEFIKEKTKIFCENCDRRRGMKDGKLTDYFVYDIGDAPCRACDTGDMIDYVDDTPTIIDAEWQESEPLDDVVELMEGGNDEDSD